MGSSFIEFKSHQVANNIIRQYNNKIVNGIKLQLNWANKNSKNINRKMNNLTNDNETDYTVSNGRFKKYRFSLGT